MKPPTIPIENWTLCSHGQNSGPAPGSSTSSPLAPKPAKADAKPPVSKPNKEAPEVVKRKPREFPRWYSVSSQGALSQLAALEMEVLSVQDPKSSRHGSYCARRACPLATARSSLGKLSSLGSLGSRAPEERLERTAFLPGRGVALSGDLADFAGRKPTPLRLTEILAMKTPEGLQSILQELGWRPEKGSDWKHAGSRRLMLDHNCLWSSKDMKDILSVRADFAASFEEVLQAKSEDFRDVIRRFKKRNEDHALRLTRGMQAWSELQQAKGEPYEDTRAFIDTFLNRLFLSRIGMETLTSQYLALSKCPDGIVEVQCDPCKICASAAKQVTELAGDYFTSIPRVEISFHGSEQARTLPLISHYLFYIVAELLKNSFRAVCEQHQAQGLQGTPEPLQIRVASDDMQVALLVMDRGGGIPFERQPHVWSYMYSTARGNRICGDTGRILDKGTAGPTPFSGYGVGLPLSRLYAEYLGGSLHLMSMPNFGTHAYEIQHYESSEKIAAAARDYAEALRFKALAAEATVELSKLEA
eukprot:g20937.t1